MTGRARKKSTPGGARILIVGLILLLLLTGCVKNPVTGKRQLVLLSEAQEIEIGKASHPEVLAEFGAVDSGALQAYVAAIGQKMAQASHRPDLPWTFTVVDSPVVNAFAIPGGFVYFTRGILTFMNDEAELAGVLGHEIGHVTARHSVSQISKAQLFGLGIGLGSAFSATFRNLSDLAQLGTGLLFLRYGRDAERQSDQLGIQYMFGQNYDPRRMSRFFEVFQAMREQSGQAIPDWLSTHPAPPDRIAATSARAEELLQGGASDNLRVGNAEFLEAIDGVVFGENPRQGFVLEDQFLHPDLRFQMNFPTSWKVQNSKSAVLFAAPDGAAGVQLTLAPEAVAPEQRARQIAEAPEIELVAGSERNIAGNRAYLGEFRVTQEGGEIRVVAAFIPYRGNLYQLAGIAPAAVFATHRSALLDTLVSFRELTDSRHLNVQPDHLRIYRVQRGGRLADVAGRFPNSRIELADLERLNRISRDTLLAAGTRVKVVEAGRR